MDLRTDQPWIWRFSCPYSLVGEAGTAKAMANAERASETVAHRNSAVLGEGMERDVLSIKHFRASSTGKGDGFLHSAAQCL